MAAALTPEAARTRRLRLYRLWRTAALLCAVGAVEFGILAYLKRDAWLVLVVLPLLAVAGYAARRAATQRRSL